MGLRSIRNALSLSLVLKELISGRWVSFTHSGGADGEGHLGDTGRAAGQRAPRPSVPWRPTVGRLPSASSGLPVLPTWAPAWQVRQPGGLNNLPHQREWQQCSLRLRSSQLFSWIVKLCPCLCRGRLGWKQACPLPPPPRTPLPRPRGGRQNHMASRALSQAEADDVQEDSLHGSWSLRVQISS